MSSKLIGTNPNQVPSNADLGTAAFMDKKDFLLSKGNDMSAINAVMSDTAVDILIYDTTKDSDSGAWRHRTQNTSWYNERLNTTTRGSRKEFPAVAVIVMEVAKVTIYDADDVNMPMWMVFKGLNAGTSYTWFGAGYSGMNATCITMKNAELAIGVYGTVGTVSGLSTVNFIKEVFIKYGGAPGTVNRSISQRNISFPVYNMGTDYDIADKNVNDVAMAVLPNAPIDTGTGLPIPTIAVATDGGVSIIRDNCPTVNIVSSTAAGGGYDPHHVSFGKDNRLTILQAYDLGGQYLSIFDSLPEVNVAQALSYPSATNYTYLDTGLNITGTTGSANFADLAHGKDDIALGSHKQLTLLNSTPGAPTKSMVAYVTSDYNTGWMVGDTKLATLSDTNMVDLDGTELVSQTASGWNLPTGFSHNGSGTLTGASNTGQYSKASISSSFVVGKVYTVTFNVTAKSGSMSFWINDSASYSNNWTATNEIAGTGIKSHTFTASDTTGYVVFQCNSLGNTITVSDISVREAEADRTINNKGLRVFGTVPKTPVMPGAELMAYGPFTSSNYLEQPYNSDLNFGTGDFMYSMWIYRNSLPTSTHERWFGSSSSNQQDRIDIFSNNSTDNIAFYSSDAGAVRGDVRMTGIGTNKWHCFHFTRQANVYHIYHDGELRATNVGSATLADYGVNTDRKTHIGAAEHWDTGHAVLDGRISLAKISGTVPTSQQIRKMYNDEKHLFQENAKATLYGTSNAVTALAYDDDIDTLHVGTSAGRSDFQGLRRINNTTRAIGSTMSANDGLIVEE